MNSNLIGPTIPTQSWLFSDNFTGLDYEREFYRIVVETQTGGKK